LLTEAVAAEALLSTVERAVELRLTAVLLALTVAAEAAATAAVGGAVEL
jgi:hypothetical protein